jgi:hypothetical protein
MTLPSLALLIVLVFGLYLHHVDSANNDTFSMREKRVRESALCPNFCNYRGVCVTKAHYSPNGICQCYPGFYGVDCSLRTCPAGNAWVDFPSANNEAHAAFTECSNMGTCDRSTGTCQCKPGFGGPACDVMLCPTGGEEWGNDGTVPCSGNGKCLSLRDAGRKRDYINYFNATEYVGWDADMIHGCDCYYGFEGRACERRSCPKGDDPETAGVDEVQLIDCTCTTCSGGMYITFKGETSKPIPYDASEAVILSRLMAMQTIQSVNVRIAYGIGLCSSTGSVTKITFKIPHGDVPDITTSTYGTLAGTIAVKTGYSWSGIEPHTESATCTREYAECSNRGTCNYNTGACECIPGFTSSDGFGNAGTRGDCGYRNQSDLTYYEGTGPTFKTYLNNTVDDEFMTSLGYTVAGTTNCPFTPFAGICSGHGRCNTDNVCVCDRNYEGVLCDSLTCGTTTAWWGDDVGGSVNHTKSAVCGNIGTCDGTTGKCVDCGGSYGSFSGDRCEALACPVDSGGNACGNNGYCRSMRHLPEFQYMEDKTAASYTYTEPWDADLIKGCACMRNPSIDNRYNWEGDNNTAEVYPSGRTSAFDVVNSTNRFYRGPYSFAATDYTGYACSQAQCPRGDNPSTRNDANEVQKIQCTAAGGHFYLTFRENTTLAIGYNDPRALLAWKLEQLYTVHQVSVQYLQSDGVTASTDNVLCTTDGSNYAHIEFETEHGDLPLMTATVVESSVNILYTLNNQGARGGVGTVTITEHLKGTKEDVECSGQGLCDQDSGRCDCLEGYSSSNGTIHGVGNWGDCTFRNKWMS